MCQDVTYILQVPNIDLWIPLEDLDDDLAEEALLATLVLASIVHEVPYDDLHRIEASSATDIEGSVEAEGDFVAD